MELAHAVKEVASQGSHFQFLYNLQVGPDEIICVKKKKKKLYEHLIKQILSSSKTESPQRQSKLILMGGLNMIISKEVSCMIRGLLLLVFIRRL